jgi:CHASE1-domain containing sensor protein
MSGDFFDGAIRRCLECASHIVKLFPKGWQWRVKFWPALAQKVEQVLHFIGTHGVSLLSCRIRKK